MTEVIGDDVAKTQHLLLKRNLGNNTNSSGVDNVAKTQHKSRASPICLGGLKWAFLKSATPNYPEINFFFKK